MRDQQTATSSNHAESNLYKQYYQNYNQSLASEIRDGTPVGEREKVETTDKVQRHQIATASNQVPPVIPLAPFLINGSLFYGADLIKIKTNDVHRDQIASSLDQDHQNYNQLLASKMIDGTPVGEREEVEMTDEVQRHQIAAASNKAESNFYKQCYQYNNPSLNLKMGDRTPVGEQEVETIDEVQHHQIATSSNQSTGDNLSNVPTIPNAYYWNDESQENDTINLVSDDDDDDDMFAVRPNIAYNQSEEETTQ